MTRNECNKMIRINLGIGQASMARSLGIAPATLSRYEKGDEYWSRRVQRKVEQWLDDAVQKIEDSLLKTVCEMYQYGRKKGF